MDEAASELAGAPHHIFCKAHYIYAGDPGSHKCNCWKSKSPNAGGLMLHDADVWDQVAYWSRISWWRKLLPLGFSYRAIRKANPYRKEKN